MRINSYLRKFMEDFYVKSGFSKCHLSHNDLDGYACQVTTRMFQRGTEPIQHENATVPSTLNDGSRTVDFINRIASCSDKVVPMLLITDLGLGEEIVDELNRSGIYYAVVDHHVLSDSVKEKLGDRLYHEEDGHCAAYLLYRLISASLIGHMQNRFYGHLIYSFEHYIDSVDKYDTGNFGHWNENDLDECSDPIKEQLLFLGYGQTKYVSAVETSFVTNNNHLRKDIIQPQFDLLAFQYDMVKTYTYHNVTFDFENGTSQTIAVCPFSVPMYSIIANRYLKENKDLGVVAMAFIDLKRKHVSMRSLDDSFDCQEYCKQYNGGGHKNAAGFDFEYIEYGNKMSVRCGSDTCLMTL